MKILFINSLWPHLKHTVRSGNIVFYELLSNLAKQEGVEVGYCYVCHGKSKEEADAEALDELSKMGVRILDPLQLPEYYKPSVFEKIQSRCRRIFREKEHAIPFFEDVYSKVDPKHLIEKHIRAFKADVLFVPWTEWLTVLCSFMPYDVFAYYGNPDPKPQRARVEFDLKHGDIDDEKYQKRIKYIDKFEKCHMGVMNRLKWLGNVAANDAEYYQKMGHQNAFYIQNVWFDRLGSEWENYQPSSREDGIFKIVGNIGKLSGTANTYGLELLCNELMPILEEELRSIDFEVHIYGATEPHPVVKRLLSVNPRFKVRGFVEDIDKELMESDVFLCVNNGTDYNVGHTRYLHAWSLGCCVVAHNNVRLAMPELEDGLNALLGRDTKEIASKIRQVAESPELKNKIQKGGYQTFKENFVAEKVAVSIVNKIREIS